MIFFCVYIHEVTHSKLFNPRTTELSRHAALQWNCLAGCHLFPIGQHDDCGLLAIRNATLDDKTGSNPSKVDCFCPFRVTEDKKLQALRYDGMFATTVGVVIITGRPVWIEVISARERHHRIHPNLKYFRLDRCARSLGHQHRQKTNLALSWSPITVLLKIFFSGATSSQLKKMQYLINCHRSRICHFVKDSLSYNKPR